MEDCRILRASRAVFDLDRESDLLVEDRDAVDAFGTDFGDHATLGFLDDQRVESIRSAEQERARGDRPRDARRDLVAARDRGCLSRERPRHRLE